MTKPIYLTTAEVATLRGTTTRQIQRLAKAGLLPVAKTSARGVLLFKASDARRAPVTLRVSA